MSQIEIQHLYKSYRNRRHHRRGPNDYDPGEEIPVLEDVNLCVENGEMVCILGPSGCGKSTLLRMVAGFDRQTSGEILIDGQPVTGPTSDNIFVFQQSGLLPWMTVWQNVELGLRRLTDQAEKTERIQEAISLVDLEGAETLYPHQLSGGMKRRAELARALVVNPKILIMDEPFTGLDFFTHLRMREEVVNMHEFIRKTTLIVTHDIDDALLMGDRIVVMSGRPSHVKLEKVLDFPHPRNLAKHPELNSLREEVFFMLGVSDAV